MWNLLQNILDLSYLFDWDHNRKFAPIKHVIEWEWVVVRHHNGDTVWVDGFNPFWASHFVATRTKTKFAMLNQLVLSLCKIVTYLNVFIFIFPVSEQDLSYVSVSSSCEESQDRPIFRVLAHEQWFSFLLGMLISRNRCLVWNLLMYCRFIVLLWST